VIVGPVADALRHTTRRGPRVIEKEGKPVNARHIGMLMKKVTKLAGLEPTEGIHRLRHTFCSRLADAGAPTEAIRRLARHTTMAVTQRYLHASDATLENAMGLLNR
jgi:site-specific recombinase XerD